MTRIPGLAAVFALAFTGMARAQYVEIVPNCSDVHVAVSGQNHLIADSTGKLCTAPVQLTPMAGAQYGLAVASSTALTVPSGAKVAVVTVEGTSIRYTTDGATTPTNTIGTGPYAGGTTLMFSLSTLATLRIIQTSATATVNVEYFK